MMSGRLDDVRFVFSFRLFVGISLPSPFLLFTPHLPFPRCPAPRFRLFWMS